jgi:oligosaccharide repeat unit polymerase
MDLLPPTLLLICSAVGLRIAFRTWLTPAGCFSLFWSVLVLLALLTHTDYPLKASGLWFILACSWTVILGEISVGRKEQQSITPLRFDKLTVMADRLRGPLAVCITSGIVCIIRKRFLGTELPTLGDQLLLSLNYAGLILGGLLWGLSGARSSRILALAGILPTLLLGIVITGRSSVYLGVVLWAASYLSSLVLLNTGKVRLWTKNHILAGTVIVVFLFGFVWLLTMFRAGTATLQDAATVGDYQSSISDQKASEAWGRARSVYFGQLSAFCYWFDLNWPFDRLDPTLGCYTFAGPFDFFGIGERPYSEDVQLEPGERSNVYTFFKELITDFTLPGALIALFLLGLVGSVLYRSVASGSLACLVPLACLYAFIMFSCLSSLLRYNSPIVAALVASISLRLARRKNEGAPEYDQVTKLGRKEDIGRKHNR